MRVLLITGKAASRLVEEYASKSNVDFEVYVMPYEVAALIPIGEVAKMLKHDKVEGFDCILLPGLVSGDASVIEREVGVPAFKGPMHVADLPYILPLLGRVELSKIEPACKVLSLRREEEEKKELEAVEDELKRYAFFDVAGISIARGALRIVAEVTSAPLKGLKRTVEEALLFRRAGADIIDLGMMSGEVRPDDAYRLVNAVKKELGGAVSIDSLAPLEIKAAVDAGADLVVSVDKSTVQDLEVLPKDVPLVLVPTDVKSGLYPSSIDGKLKGLEEAMNAARGLGFKRLIADPILSPPLYPSFIESVAAYMEFSKRHPEVPLMMGVGNVTELMDVDSVGINGLMAALAAELEVSLLLTTEASNKTKGCVRELCVAARMAKIARRRVSPPKDIGLNLLVVKEKRDATLPPEAIGAKKATPCLGGMRGRAQDPAGYVKITVDKSRGTIVASHFKDGALTCSIESHDANSILEELISRGLISTLDHAAYVGGELEKAKIALILGKSYIQDKDLDFGATSKG